MGATGAAIATVSSQAISFIFSLIYMTKKGFKFNINKSRLITDCMRAGGMPDGDYTLGGQPVHKEGIQCLMPDGTIAGSVLKLNEAVYNLYSNTELPIEAAVAAASLNPAMAIGEDKEIGSLEVGKRADIIIADDKFNILKTIIGGYTRYEH